MDTQQELQIGDIVRVRRSIALQPLDPRAPEEIPAGIFGEVIDFQPGDLGELRCRVDFHEPYEIFSEIPIGESMLELVFRIG